MGEIGCVATAGAVADALFSYDGIRRFRLPRMIRRQPHVRLRSPGRIRNIKDETSDSALLRRYARRGNLATQRMKAFESLPRGIPSTRAAAAEHAPSVR